MSDAPKAPPRGRAAAPRLAPRVEAAESPKAPASNTPRERPAFEVTKAGILAHNAAYPRPVPRTAPTVPFGPTELPPSARMRGRLFEAERETRRAPEWQRSGRFVPDGFEAPELAPPPFLSPLEAMSDIYLRTRGRRSRKTQTLLESPALEDLLALLARLHTRDDLLARGEARFDRRILAALGPDPGPIVLGFHDARLAEPWRLFLEEWDIWTPADGDDAGVELFWEGEAEDDVGRPIALVAALAYQRGEATLYAQMGALEDRITFDGETFFRLDPELAPRRVPH